MRWPVGELFAWSLRVRMELQYSVSDQYGIPLKFTTEAYRFDDPNFTVRIFSPIAHGHPVVKLPP